MPIFQEDMRRSPRHGGHILSRPGLGVRWPVGCRLLGLADPAHYRALVLYVERTVRPDA